MRLVAAPDKFRGTATGAEVAAAMVAAARAHGWDADAIPLADGGEGTLLALGGPNRTSTVTGPLGTPVEAHWRLDGRTAVIEMAAASGLTLAGGSAGNDPVAASTRGTGELVRIAIESGARRVIVCVGGSATTDGGLGALGAIGTPARLREIELVVACDVRTTFVEAAQVFAPQKGASPAQVRLLENRLRRLAEVYEADHGVDVRTMVGSGAAGGLAGGLAALGASLVDGFSLVAEELALDEKLDGADLVVTGEGYLDAESFNGKVVGGVVEFAADAAVPVVAVVGDADAGVASPDVEVVSLVDRFGSGPAMEDTLRCVRSVVEELVSRR